VPNPLPFREAREWARSLGLRSTNEWKRYPTTKLHPGVPKDAATFYGEEWTNWGDFLGTGQIAPAKKKFRSYLATRLWVRSQGIRSDSEWNAAVRAGLVPSDIPRNLRHSYPNEWTSSGDFYGTGVIANTRRNWRSLAKAKNWARQNHIYTPDEWRAASKAGLLPSDIPSMPNRAYGIGWPELFGTKVRGGSSFAESVIARELSQFIEVDEHVRTILLSSTIKKRVDIVLPTARVVLEYDGATWHSKTIEKDRREIDLFRNAGWRLIRIREQPLLPLSNDDVIVSPKHSLHKRAVTVLNHLLLLELIPSSKRRAIERYTHEGRLRASGEELPHVAGWAAFKNAKKWARSLRLSSTSEYRRYVRQRGLPKDIPSAPELVYESDWQGWADYLGTKNEHFAPKDWRPFEEARQWVKDAGIKTYAEWNRWVKLRRIPLDIPRRPHCVYLGEWVSYPHWFGKNVTKGQRYEWLSFEEARKWARQCGATCEREWRKLVREGRLPAGIPTNPQKLYAKSWRGMGDWLDTGTVSTKRQNFLPFAKARKLARSLGLMSETEWRQYKAGRRLPEGVPASPASVYANKGWAGWADWLRADR
jgi:very-short-patch-repair endonuclease